MDALHERADRPFDVPAEMRAAGRSKLDANTVVFAASTQRLPFEIRAVVGVHALRYAPDWPLSGRRDLAARWRQRAPGRTAGTIESRDVDFGGGA